RPCRRCRSTVCRFRSSRSSRLKPVPDPRFFQSLTPLSVSALAERVGGEVVRGGDRMIAAVAPLASAEGGDAAFLGDRKFLAALQETRAGCVFAPEAARDAAPEDCALVISSEPQAAWARASLLLHRALTLDEVESVEQAAEDDTV